MEMSQIIKKIKRKLKSGCRRIVQLSYPCCRKQELEVDPLEVLRKIKNRHQGQKCVVVGMGPSLKVSDLDAFKGCPTIACNKIFLAFENTSWRPDYYMVSDVLVAEQNKSDIEAIEAEKYFPSWVASHSDGLGKINWIPVSQSNSFVPGESVGFSKDLTKGIEPGGCTVIYDMLQLAYHLGFVEVALVGIDFSFTNSKTSGVSCEQGEVLVSEGEVNHFSKDYRKEGEKWTIPKLEEQKIAFAEAVKAFEEDGRILVNASRQTQLEVVPRVDFNEYFSDQR